MRAPSPRRARRGSNPHPHPEHRTLTRTLTLTLTLTSGERYVDLALLGEFPRLKRLWMSTEELASALVASSKLELDADGRRVRRRPGGTASPHLSPTLSPATTPPMCSPVSLRRPSLPATLPSVVKLGGGGEVVPPP